MAKSDTKDHSNTITQQPTTPQGPGQTEQPSTTQKPSDQPNVRPEEKPGTNDAAAAQAPVVGNTPEHEQTFAPKNEAPSVPMTDTQRAAHAAADANSDQIHDETNLPVDNEGHQGKDEHYQTNA